MNQLIGRYKLISHGIYDQAAHFKETSAYLNGELIYSNNGYLSVLIFFKNDPESNRDFLAYSGTYEIVGPKEIIHKINICSQSKRNNSDEKRDYQIENDFLILSCEIEDGKRFEAKWKRLDSF